MERLLVLKLDALGCEAEAWLNGVPLARVDTARERAVVPIHEYTLAGANQLELVVWPRPAVPPEQTQEAVPVTRSLTSDGVVSAHLRVLLPRIGHAIDEASARTLAQIDWTPAAKLIYTAPLTLSQDVTLPVNFPRWRWLDVPAHALAHTQAPSAALTRRALEFVQRLGADLASGNPDSFITATRWRNEELAVAYQRQPDADAARLRAHLLARHAAHGLDWQPLEPDNFCLRSLAGGRLLECLDARGAPALQTVPDALGQTLALPLRLTVLDEKVYVLR